MTAVDQVRQAVLDEMDAILDREDARDGVVRSPEDRRRGRDAMEQHLFRYWILTEERAEYVLREHGVAWIRETVQLVMGATYGRERAARRPS